MYSRLFSTLSKRIYRLPDMQPLHFDFEPYHIHFGLNSDLMKYKGVAESSCSLMNYYLGLGLIHYGHSAYLSAIPYFKKSIALASENVISDASRNKIITLQNYAEFVAEENPLLQTMNELRMKILQSRVELAPIVPYWHDLGLLDRMQESILTEDDKYICSTIPYYAGLAYINSDVEWFDLGMYKFQCALEMAESEQETSDQFKRELVSNIGYLHQLLTLYNAHEKSRRSHALISILQSDPLSTVTVHSSKLREEELQMWRKLNCYERIRYAMGFETCLVSNEAYRQGLAHFSAGESEYHEAYLSFKRAKLLEAVQENPNEKLLTDCREKINFIIDYLYSKEGKHVEEIIYGPRYP
jgi:hypothetical protein